MADEKINVVTPNIQPSAGTAGQKTQVHGNASTVSAAAEATGGIAPGNFIMDEIDQNLFAFKGDDTPPYATYARSKES